MEKKAPNKKEDSISNIAFENNLSFKDNLDIKIITNEDIGISENIKIANCTNLSEITITGKDHLEYLEINYSISNNIISLTLKDCTIRKIIINGTHININIENCIISEIEINNCNGEYLVISSNSAKGKVKELLVIISKFFNIKIKNNEIDQFKISNITYCNIMLMDSIFGTINFTCLYGIEFKGLASQLFSFHNCFLIEIKNITVNTSFDIHDFKKPFNNYQYKIILDNLTLNCFGTISIIRSIEDETEIISLSFKIDLIKVNHGLSIYTVKKERTILSTFIFYTTSCEGILKFGNLNIKNASLIGANLKLLTSFDQCTFDEVDFRDFDNKGIVKFTNSGDIGELNITNSELNDVIFRPLKANSIVVKPDSFLGGLKLYGSDAINLDNTDLSPENKQEFYRQLKQAAKNSNNKFLELEYKAKEMAYYKPTSWGDKRSLWVNSLSNHGTNWVKPLIFIIYWNIVIWLLISYNLYTSYFVISIQKGYTLTHILVNLSFGLWIVLNPVSRMSEFSAYLEYYKPVHTLVPILFFSAKIINGILIYQMISAFRKWVARD